MSYESDFALLAAGSYWDVRKFANDPPFDNRAPLPAGWEIVPEYDRSQSGGVGNGFSARVYKNTASGDVVISYGGTEFGNTLSGFIADFINGNIPLVAGRYGVQALEAAKLYQQVKADQSLSDNISFTGHSLGGGLASVMAVWFDRPAMVFAAAPFQASVDGTQVALLGVSVPALYQVKGLLTQAGIPLDPALDSYNPLVDFATREGNVTAYAIKGEELEDKLGGFNWIESTPNPLFNNSAITLDSGNKHSIDLHAAALLVPSFQTQAAVVPNALTVLMDAALYGGSATGNQQLLITKLVRNEVGVRDSSGDLILSPNAMLSHFTADLQKLGANLAGLNAQAQSAIVAQGIEWYYWQTTNYSGQEFLSVSSGVLNYTTAKGADLEGALNKANPYVNSWLAPLFSIGAVQTTGMRAATDWGVFDEWHVSTAAATTTAQAVDASKVQIFVGNTGADTFIGGNKDDVMLGGAGNDILAGGGGNDKLYGGAGVDYYAVTGAFGKDTITDSDGQGVIQIDGHAIGTATSAGRDVWVAQTAPGQYVGLAVYEAPGSGNGKTLVITRAGSTANTITINNFNLEQAKGSGYMGIKLDNTQKVALIDKPGTSVFSQPGFNTDTLNGLVASFKEGTGKGYILQLAAPAKANDTITLALGGDASGFKAILGDTTVTANGAVITLKEGQTQVGFALVQEEGISEDISATLQAHYSGAAGNASSNSWGVTVTDAGEVEGSLSGDFVAVTEALDGDPINRLVGTKQVEVVKDGELYFEKDADGNLRAGTTEPTQRPIFNEAGEVVGYEQIPSNDLMVTDNVLFGTAARDRVNGLTGNDALVGDAGADELDGGMGNDLIAGGAGSDVIKGGSGNDIISSAGDLARSLQQLGPGDLWDVWGKVPGSPVFTQGTTWGAHGTVVRPSGSFNNEQFFRQGDMDGDLIDAGAGDDFVAGSDGPDAVKGGEGNDAIAGRGGDDVLEGGDDNDVIEGDSATVVTATGRLWTPAGRHGNDFVDGGAGNDVLWGNGGNDQLFGGTGNDALLGDDSEPSNPWALGADHHGQDYLDGEDGNDSLVGGGGDDVLYGGIGDDDLLGDDRALTGTRHGNDYLDGQDGNDLMLGGGGADRVYGGAGNDVLHGDDDLEHLPADFHGDDYLDGGTGNDTLVGGGGNDVLVGGAGQDYLVGGDGDDYYVVDIGDAIMDTGGTNTISMTGGEPVRISVEGKNLVMHFGGGGAMPQLAALDGAPMTEDLGESLGTVLIQNALEGGDFELNGTQLNDEWFGTYDVELTTTADDQHLSSWAGNDTLTALHNAATLSGGAGNNVLKGGAGADTLVSSGGVDQLTGGGGDDTFQITAQAGVVSIATGAANAGFGHDTLVLPGSVDDTTLAVTTEGADGVITTVRRVAQEGGAVLETPGPTVRLLGLFANGAGQAPVDSIAAIQFADGTSVSLQQLLASGMMGGPADDVLSGSLLADVMDGGGGNDQLMGYAGNDTLLGGTGDDQLSGGSGQDSLEGGAGNDVLTGGYGSDVLRGGAGDDVYVFGAEANPQLENDLEAGQQIDVIYDTEGTNTIEFGDGVNLAAIGYVKVSDTVSQYFYNGHKIEVHGTAGDALIRANGSVVPPATLAVTGGTSLPDESLSLAQQAFFAQHESAAKAAITQGVLAGAFMLQHTSASTALWQSLTSDEPVLSNISLVRNEVITTQHVGVVGYRDANGNTVPSNIVNGGYPLPLQGANPVQALQAVFDSQEREITVTSAAPAAIERVTPAGGGAVTWNVTAWSWTGRDNSLTQIFGDYTVTNTKTTHDALAAHVLLGDSDNAINLGAGVVHAGAGNDSILGYDNWYYPASEGMRQVLLSGITANYLDGGDGNDTIRGSELNDVIVGGRGRDVLDGHKGSDRYLVLDYGVGSTDEDIITDLAYTYTGPYAPLSAPLDAGGDAMAPQTQTTGRDIDVVEFGPGISLAQLDFLREPDADDPSGTGWLVVLMQGRRLASIKLAADDAPAGSGIEILAFHGGQTISMANALTLANTVLPLSVGELTGVQTLEDGDFQYEVGGQISGGSGALTVSASLADGSALPSWLTFDAATRSFHGTPSNAPAGTLTVRLTVTDAAGQSTAATFPIVVEGVNDAPQADVALGDQHAVLGQTLALQLDARLFVDVDAGDALGWQVRQADGSSLPAWLGFDPATRTLTGTPGSSDLNALALEVVVTDQAGASASQGFLLVVHESDPAYVYGTSGPDTLYGNPGNNILVGGAGDDVLMGGEGNDVYLFSPGDGSDSVIDSDGTPGNVDTLRFAAGVLPSQIRVARDVNGLMLEVTGTGDKVLLHSWLTNPHLKIERVEFADGTVWDEAALLSRIDNSGTPGDDYLFGTPGPDTLEGLGGYDELQGGTGNDVYLFGRGMGYDWVYDYDETPGNTDTFRFDATVQPGDVTITRTWFNDLSFRINGTDEGVDVSDWLLDDASKIERIEFDNGTVWNVADIHQRIVNATATDGPDTLIGYLDQDDALNGGAGDDAVYTGSGNDTLTGGRGNDTLDGDVGQDTYLFSRGDGTDTVHEWAVEPGTDVARFDATVGPGDIHLTRDEYHLYLNNSGSGDQVVLAYWFLNDLHGVEEIQFADGTTLGEAAIHAALAGNGQIGGNRAPVAAQAQPDQEAVDNEAWSLVLPQDMFSDADAGDTLSWQLVQAGGQALPGWLAFDAATRTVAGTPPAGQSVVLTLEARVTDGRGAVASQTFKLTVGEAMGLTIVGTAAADNLIGTAGNDTIDGLGRADTMTGAAGNDSYVVDNTRDQVIELAGQGYDHIQASVGYTLPVHVEALTLLGTRNLAATGNALANVLVGNSGSNRLDGGAGADALRGGAGNDVYVVDDAGDVLTELTGQGTDTVLASVSYTLPSQVERLTLTGSQAGLSATGNELNNLLVANAAGSALAGLAGNDVLRGADGADTLLGGDGNDRLEGNAGADQMAGGAGNDVYVVDDVADGVWELAGEGTDTVLASVSYTLGGDVERLTLTGTAVLTGTGNALNNLLVASATGSTLVGLAGNDTLRGGAGNDALQGGEGNDRLDGGAGADLLVGGTGNDVYVVDDAGDTIQELAGEGTDTVQTVLGYTLGNELENLTITGSAAVSATGNALNNVLNANDAGNTLRGMAGNDTLRGGDLADVLEGGTGNDRLEGGKGGDTYLFARGDAADTLVENDATTGVADVLKFAAGINASQLWFRKTGNNLEVSVIGTTNKVTVSGWYLSADRQVEVFELANGQQLLNTEVQALVQAMAAYTPPAQGQVTLVGTYETNLGGLIAATWG